MPPAPDVLNSDLGAASQALEAPDAFTDGAIEWLNGPASP
jgi:hypothetical protein